MQGINDIMFVFYYKPGGQDVSGKEYVVSQPVTIGELIDGDVELELSDGSSLPMNDIDWESDELKMAIVPNKKAGE